MFNRRRKRLTEERERLARTQREIERVDRQWPTVRELVAAMRQHDHDRDTFADQISGIFRGET